MRIITLNREDVYRGYLRLINQKYPILGSGERDMELLPAATGSSVLVEAKIKPFLSDLILAVGGEKEIVPVSGYRSKDEQEQIYTDTLREEGEEFTRKYVALPGQSEHQSGLAIDLGKKAEEIDFICPDFPYTGICGEFRRKAADYGFIQRYEQGKEHITGIACEPWHFRYVGYPHAQIMKNHGLCLEEYIRFIKDFPYGQKCYHYSSEQGDFTVGFVRATGEKTDVTFSETEQWQISGNNADGFIITVLR